MSVLQVADLDFDNGEWRRFAECRNLDPEVFFPVGTNVMAAEQVETAKNVCNVCIVKQSCLEYAISSNQDCGVWGGLTEEERRSARRSRRAMA